MNDPKPPPRCPLHRIPMFPDGIEGTHEKFRCHDKCSIRITRPLNLPLKPTP